MSWLMHQWHVWPYIEYRLHKSMMLGCETSMETKIILTIISSSSETLTNGKSYLTGLIGNRTHNLEIQDIAILTTLLRTLVHTSHTGRPFRPAWTGPLSQPVSETIFHIMAVSHNGHLTCRSSHKPAVSHNGHITHRPSHITAIIDVM